MASYNALNNNSGSSPYGSGDPFYNESTGYITPQPAAKKAGTSPWIKFGIPVAIVIIIAAVVGGVVGSRHSSSSSSSSGASGGSKDPAAAASSAASVKSALGRYATATNSKYMVPIYPSTTNAAAFTQPTFVASSKSAWPADPFKPGTPSPTTVRDDRPRLFAPSYKWDALANLVQTDPYMKGWNDTIFGNATDYYNKPPVVYFMDGDSGILDNAREVKQRLKAFAYVYRITKDSKWVDRAWNEIQTAIGPTYPDTDKWNTAHFLDAAEYTSAFAIAYDWMYDMWDDDKKATIRNAMITYGMGPGLSVYEGGASFGWWSSKVFGNWNCVCNAGLTVGALSILKDDTTGTAEKLLSHTIQNAKDNCAQAVTDDGSWHETPNYWYFGTTGHAEMASALMTATGSDYDLLTTNTNYWKTGLYHMYISGPTSLYDYGDHGPNKFSSTANCMFLYADSYNQPTFALHQRDRADAAEPWSMFWYDPAVSGAFWDQLPLDHFFDNDLVQWGSMRSSWTDQNALFVAIKAGKNQGHETHNDLDVGDFVIDALGTRFAGEYGSADYRSPEYFNSDAQNATRWLYFRKRTEAQSTLMINKDNQNVLAAPTIKHDTTGEKQDSSTVYTPPKTSTAFFTMDMTSAYFQATSIKRGIRMLNGRRQVLLQDEIDAQAGVQWRMQTNATITINGASASLALDGQTMEVQILNPPSGAQFSQQAAERLSSDPTPPVPDQVNPGVSILIIDLPAGKYNLQVLFNPQWPGMSSNDFVTPQNVALDSWSNTSHN
ncbi:heparinase II/III family protein [Crepidotus variabilis]|uniref:Heparinase II/III family protein n=1 Tax=Crepidotus variabilis TaxID=179855 RepID=A0A9P6EEX2_9AGAR|nr:heparinase II/III family protein [Crepidotus variabilis]